MLNPLLFVASVNGNVPSGAGETSEGILWMAVQHSSPRQKGFLCSD